MFFTASYRELEEITSIDKATWSRWFNRKASPNLRTLEKLAKVFDMHVIEFIEAFYKRQNRCRDS